MYQFFVSADGRVSLHDMAYLQTCFGKTGLNQANPGASTGPCLAQDQNADGLIDLADFNAIRPLITGP